MNDKFDELAKNMAQSVTRRPGLARFAACIAGVLLVSPGMGLTRANDFRLGPLVDLSDPDALAACGSNGAEKETYVAVNPANPKNVVAAWIGGAFTAIGTAVSFDGGKQWQQIVIPGVTVCTGGSFDDVADPWLSFSPNGELYAICDAAGFKNGVVGDVKDVNRKAILVSKSLDGGLHWSNPTALSDVSDKHFFTSKPSITADPTDSRLVYAVWVLVPNGNRGQALFSRTTDGGRTWEATRSIYDPATQDIETTGHQILVLPDGTLVDLFTEFKNGDTGANKEATLSLIASADHGLTWSAPIHVAVLPIFGVTAPDSGIPVISGGTFPPLFAAAVDRNNGTLYAVWQDMRFSGGQYSSIAFAQSADRGQTWSEPIAVNQTPANPASANRQAFIPTVAVAADGTIGVAYYDFRFNDGAPGALTDYWLVHCHPSSTTPATNPVSWGNEVRLTASSFDVENAPLFPEGYFIGDYQGLATVGNDFLAAWSQPHDTDLDSIFFRRVGP